MGAFTYEGPIRARAPEGHLLFCPFGIATQPYQDSAGDIARKMLRHILRVNRDTDAAALPKQLCDPAIGRDATRRSSFWGGGDEPWMRRFYAS